MSEISPDDVTERAAALGIKLDPWQAEATARMLTGQRVSIAVGHRSGYTEWLRVFEGFTAAELAGRRLSLLVTPQQTYDGHTA